MTINLIVEDGSLPAGANSYAGLAVADAYIAGRAAALPGFAAWLAADEEARIAALIRAADVLNGYHWRGMPALPGRIMAWPRLLNDELSNPPQVVAAQCELAAIIIGGDDPLATVEPIAAVKIDAFSLNYTATEAKGGHSAASVARYPAVAGLLRGLLRNGSGGGPCGAGGVSGGIGQSELGRG